MERITEKHDVWIFDFHNLKMVNEEDFRYLKDVDYREDWKPVTCEIAKLFCIANSNVFYITEEQKDRAEKYYKETDEDISFEQAIDFVKAKDDGII